jgi:flavin-dependent dehydrogenase
VASLYGVDLFVIGGGPAGLATAITACRKGLTVVVADGSTPPIDKPCGEGLMPETRRALRDLGIEVTETAGFALRGIRFLAAGAATEAEFPEGEGLGVRRTTLHEALMIAAERAGAKLLWKTPVVGIGARGVHLADRFVASRWIVGADGSGSRVRKWSGLEGVKKESARFAARRHYRVKPWTKFMEIYWGKARQAYVTPVSRHEVCVAVLAETRQETEFEAALEKLPEIAVRLSGGEVSSRERGAITQMRRLRRVTVGNVVLVGDASRSCCLSSSSCE